MTSVERRTFLGAWLMLLLGFGRLRAASLRDALRRAAPKPLWTKGAAEAGRRLLAQGFRALRYRALARPVLVPLAELSAPWRAKLFVAEAVSLSSGAKPNQPIRINGIVVRTAAGESGTDQFKAVCVVCPHEQCDVDFVADPSQLATDVVAEIGPVKDPVYLCPCHNSTFRAEDGERLGGPAPRGLYRFRVTRVTDAAVEIAEVEEDALIFTV